MARVMSRHDVLTARIDGRLSTKTGREHTVRHEVTVLLSLGSKA